MALSFWLGAALVLVGLQHALTAPLTNSVTADTNVTVGSIKYLSSFGYYEEPSSRLGVLRTEEGLANSLRMLQRFAGIAETGVFDAATAQVMKTSRCGVPDFGPMDSAKKRKRRYALQGTQWSKRDLTWRLTNDNNDGLSRDQVEATLERAFAMWSGVTTLTFTKSKDTNADILVSFVRYYHKDPYPFDGMGGTLAHAFYPHNNVGLAGDLHFDDDEVFTLGTPKGKNLLWVAVHEIGHSIGLEHSNVRDAIMYPWYKGYQGDDFTLTHDDIVGIQTIYGSKPVATAATTAPPSQPADTTQAIAPTTKPISASSCTDHIGAVFLGKDKLTYVINQDKLYIVGKSLESTKGPTALSAVFSGLSSADAVYRRPDGKLVFFRGTQYFVFDGYTRESGPHSIHSYYRGLPTTVTKIDAAFVWPGNGRTYLFVGTEYYRFDHSRAQIDYGYPKAITVGWKGVPGNVDSVFVWRNGHTYFFKGSQYYKVERIATGVQVADTYPREILPVWIKCAGGLTSTSRSSSTTIFASFSLVAMATTLTIFVAKALQ